MAMAAGSQPIGALAEADSLADVDLGEKLQVSRYAAGACGLSVD